MKYCYECGRVTGGEPLFCQFCGRSYDVKLCPRMHPSPRFATVCSQCGSRDLSTPQPKVSLWWKALGFLLRILSGILLIYLSLFTLAQLLESPRVQVGLVSLGLLVTVLWALWVMLPEWFRRLVRRVLKRKGQRNER